jgi:hypothetical protein
MRNTFLSLVLLVVWNDSPVTAADADLPSAAQLADAFRKLLLPNLPNPLVEQDFNWGHQENISVGVKWERTGILLKPEIQRKLHNDGVWRRIAVTADDPDKRLELGIKDVQLPEPGQLTFTMNVQMPIHVKFEQQLWKLGARVYSGETRARATAVLQMQCESTSRFEKKPNAFFPELVMRLRVKEAKLNYYDLTVEHTAGVGGDLAKTLGDAFHESVKTLKPSLEQKLLTKANAAVVKAADTKEVRLGLSKLFGGAR